MSGDIHIGQLQAGNVHVGGENQVIAGGSGTFNNYADASAIRAELQSKINELLRAIADNATEPAVLESAEEARAEADRPQLRAARLRELMNAVLSGVDKAGNVAQAALNVLSLINKHPW